MTKLRTLLEMIKFSHSVFALPFALLAAFLAARGWPGWQPLALIIICMVAARNVAMTFNRIVDARYDAGNPRTQARALVTGQITRAAAWSFLLISAAAFVTAAVMFWVIAGNPWPLILSPIVLAYLCFYSYTKRFTSLCHFYLGAALCLSPVAAWIAINPATLGWQTLVFALGVMFWVAGFDIIYAAQDVKTDRYQGLHSLPARLGVNGALWMSRCSHLASIICLSYLISLSDLSWLYLLGVVAMAGLLLWEHLLVRGGNLARINMAFMTANGSASIVMGLLGIVDVLW